MPREPLEAIVLVGGQGTRLRPLTLSAPKPLLPTAGVPFLAHLLARAAAGGVTHVVLATCYKSDMFAACLGDGSAFGLEIDYVQEDVPLDTGGGIRNAAASLRGSGPGDPVVVLNSDVLSGHDLSAQVDLHGKTDAAVTLHLVEVDDPDGAARVLVLGWGSTFGSIGAAVRRVRNAGHSVAQVHLRHLNPFPPNLPDVLRRYDKVLLPEINLGQLALLLRGRFLVDVISYNRVRGLPFRAAELADVIEDVIGHA